MQESFKIVCSHSGSENFACQACIGVLLEAQHLAHVRVLLARFTVQEVREIKAKAFERCAERMRNQSRFLAAGIFQGWAKSARNGDEPIGG